MSLKSGALAAVQSRLGGEPLVFTGPVDLIRQLIRHPQARSLVARMVRYAMVGVAIAVIYNGMVYYLAHYQGLEPMPASMIAYALTLPLVYFGHRLHTFNSHNRILPESRRFCVAVVFSLAVTLGTMYLLADVLNLPPIVGAVTATLVIPWGNFVLLSTKVFVPIRE
jgi:putative flippase GtrA